MKRSEQIQELINQGITSPTAIAKELSMNVSYTQRLVKKLISTEVKGQIKQDSKNLDISKNITITLCKHPHENRYLMCWYTMKFGKSNIVNFRPESFVGEKVDDKLTDLHCTYNSIDELSKETHKLLLPFLPTITDKAIEFLKAFDPNVERGFDFDCPPFEVVKFNNRKVYSD